MAIHYTLKSYFKKSQLYSRFSCYIGLCLISCNVAANTTNEIAWMHPSLSLFQLGNASALFSGAIEGDTTYRQLKSKGDFGLGTFNDIDGEMVALDGNFYKISQKGKTFPVDPNWKTPFVELVKFSPNRATHFEKIDSYSVLKKIITSKLDNKNTPYAIKVTGKFQILKLRSRSPRAALQAQNVIEECYTITDVKGTLVGFWFPEYLLSITVPEFHFHFISDDRKMSGHVLELKAEYADAFINQINQIKLAFPQTFVYQSAKITAATSDNYKNSQMNDK